MKGNFIDRHPDYKALLIHFFSNLKELDSMQVNEAVRQTIKDGDFLKKQIMSFLYKFD